MTIPALTLGQMSVAILVAEGMTDKQIAAELDIAENTVGNHITRIAKVLQIDTGRNTRVQIARAVWKAA